MAFAIQSGERILMRIALCNEVIRELPLDRQAGFAADLGYDGLELAPFTLDADQPHRIDPRAIARMRADVEAAGLAVSGLHWLLVAPPGLSITSGDPGVIKATREVMRGLVDLCAGLGGSYLIHGSPAQRALAGADDAEGRKRALDYFNDAARCALDAGVVYCIEPLGPDQTNYVTSIDEAAEIVATVASPAFRTMLDCSAAAASEVDDIPELLRQYLPPGLIHHVHFNDPNRRAPGQGDLDFAPIVRTLEALAYGGWVGVEPFDYVPDGPAAAARAIGFIDGLRKASL